MPQATNDHTTPAVSRRNLPGAGAALLALGGGVAAAASAAEPDAELLAVCAEARAIDARLSVFWEAVDHFPEDDPRCEAAYKHADEHASREMPRYHDLIAQAVELPAQTVEGLHAKGLLVLANTRGGGSNSDIALSLARDVLGRA